MGESTVTELRIYCICGQKMKVSEAMFGLPGKCIACRQKIRIPHRSEIPPDATDVYLKDHPELLRRTLPAFAPLGDSPSNRQDDESDLPLGEPQESSSPPVLDILEPLRVLCSRDHRLRCQLAALKEAPTEDAEQEQATLKKDLDLVQKARVSLEETLRQRLMETTIELASAQERVAQASLSARIGEMDFSIFRDTVDRLRHRREYLERLQQNLRAWLMVDNPHVAGGYANVAADEVPNEGFEVALPPEPFDPRTLFDIHIDGLREALQRRERAALRLSEMERLKGEATMPAQVLMDCRADSKAEKLRAEAEVTFRRKRLEQVSNDCATDVQAIQACLEHARKRLANGLLDKPAFAAAEREMLRVQRDCARVHSLVTRALMASNAQDVPQPSGSLIKRMVRPMKRQPRAETDVDSWVAWGSAVALGLCVFLPLMSDLSPLQILRSAAHQGSAVSWVLVIPLLAGALATLMGAWPSRLGRGLGLGLVWLAFTAVCAVLVHEGHYGIHPLAVRFREGGPWFIRTGMILLILANAGLLGSALLALAPLKGGRIALAAIVGICGIVCAAVSTDFAGIRTEMPSLDVTWKANDSAANWTMTRHPYAAEILINNTGHRGMVLGSALMDCRNSYTILLESKSPDGLWQETQLTGAKGNREIPSGGGTVTFRQELAAGTYRARLIANAGRRSFTKPFELPQIAEPAAEVKPPAPEPPAPKAVPEPAAKEPETQPAEAPQPEPAAPPVQASPYAGVEVELRGIVRNEHRAPRFSIALYLSNATEKFLDLSVGETLFEPWTVLEFNPDRQTVTISDGSRILILKRGQRTPLQE